MSYTLQQAETIAKIPFGKIYLGEGIDIDDSTYKDLADSFNRRGLRTIQKDNYFYVWDDIGEIDLNIPLQQLGGIIAGGGFFKGIRLGIQVDKSIFNDTVPEGVPGSVNIDNTDPENPVYTQKTFEEWVEEFGYKTKLDDSNVLFRASHGGKMFNSNDITPLLSLIGSGVMILFWREFVATYNGEDYNIDEEQI